MFNEFVYVLKAGPYFKIGRTNDVTRRIAQLSTQMPFPVELFKVINTDNAARLEKELHDEFSNDRVNGEWFELGYGRQMHMYVFPPSVNYSNPDPISKEWREFIDRLYVLWTDYDNHEHALDRAFPGINGTLWEESIPVRRRKAYRDEYSDIILGDSEDSVADAVEDYLEQTADEDGNEAAK